MGCWAGFCGFLLNEMKLEALILGLVYTARHKAKSCWEGLRQELGLKGLSSLAQHHRGRLGITAPPGKTSGRYLPAVHFARCGTGRRFQEKRFNVLNDGMNLAETQRAALPLLETKPPALCPGALGHCPAMGVPRPGKRASAPQLGPGTEAEVNKGRSWYV